MITCPYKCHYVYVFGLARNRHTHYVGQFIFNLFGTLALLVMGLLPLNYRRPGHVDKEDLLRTTASNEFSHARNTSLESGRSGASSGIPDALTFDKIINGGTCPVSLHGLSYHLAPSSLTMYKSRAPSAIS